MTSEVPCSLLPALEEGATCHVLLQQKIAQTGAMGLPNAGSHVGLLDVPMWAMGCLDPAPGFTTTQRGMQGDILPVWLKGASPGH